MAALSNQLLVVTILAYLVAMVGYAVEYAFGRHGAVARVASRELVAVGARSEPAPRGLRPPPRRATGVAMPWCATCNRFLSPSTVRENGTCPTCGRTVETGGAHAT